MKLITRLKQVINELKKRKVSYALAGGLVASLYRKNPRATGDIDIVLLSKSEDLASSILQSLGLNPLLLRKANLEGGPIFAIKKKRSPVYMICGRDKKDHDAIGIDFILAKMPWAEKALHRAQENQVDFGFGKIPCLRIEDFILSKLYSFRNQSSRFMDLDDLRSVLESSHEIHWNELREEVIDLKLSFPKILRPFLPKGVKRLPLK